jgi:hypothetical protein
MVPLVTSDLLMVPIVIVLLKKAQQLHKSKHVQAFKPGLKSAALHSPLHCLVVNDWNHQWQKRCSDIPLKDRKESNVSWSLSDCSRSLSPSDYPWMIYYHPLIQQRMEHAPSVGSSYHVVVESSGLSFGRRLGWRFVVGHPLCAILVVVILFLRVLLHIATIRSLAGLFSSQHRTEQVHIMGSSPPVLRLLKLFFISDDNDASNQAQDYWLFLLLPGPHEDSLVGLYAVAVDESKSKRAREDLSVGLQEGAVDTGTSTSGRDELSVGSPEAAVDEGKSSTRVHYICGFLLPWFTQGIFLVFLFQSHSRMLPWTQSGGWLVFLH